MRYGNQTPSLTVEPTAKGAVDILDGTDAARFAERFGLDLDPWQVALCELWLRRDAKSGKFLAGTWGISVPRQNGKNGTLEAVELYGMVVLKLKFMHTAHEVKTAQKHFRRLKEFFGRKKDDPDARYPELNRLVKEIRNVNGQEAIFLHNPETKKPLGGIEIIARSDGSGRGFTNDVLVIDEAQHLKDEQLEASRPAISAAPSGDPVAIYMGTPPKPSALNDEGVGAAFVRIRNNAVSGESKRAAWMEFGLDVDPNGLTEDELRKLCTDRANWYRVNPALGRRLFEQTLEDELNEMGPRSFFRERLNVWPHAKSYEHKAIDPGAWKALCIPAVLPEWPLAAVGLDMDLSGRLWACVAAHSGENGTHVEVLPENLLAAGQDAAVAWLWERCKRRLPVVMPAESMARVLQAPLLAKGMKVYALNGPEIAQASASLAQGVADKTISHLTDALLQAAIESSERQDGKAGQWRIARAGEANGAPLLALASAHFGSVKWSKRRAGERRGRQSRKAVRA